VRARAVLARVALACGVLATVPAAAAGQSGVASAESRIDVAVLGVAATPAGLGTQSASGIDNATPTGGAVTYFDADARLAAGAGVEGRVSVRLGRRWFAEGGLSYARPRLEVRLDGDIEDAAPVTASTPIRQVIVDGALVRRLAEPRSRLVPFVTGGAGYLRQLDDPRTTVGHGQTYFGGGGVLVALGRGAGTTGASPRVRLRGDLRVVGYHGGLPLVDARRVGVVGGVGVSVRVR
jgi:hypothetical protein